MHHSFAISLVCLYVSGNLIYYAFLHLFFKLAFIALVYRLCNTFRVFFFCLCCTSQLHHDHVHLLFVFYIYCFLFNGNKC